MKARQFGHMRRLSKLVMRASAALRRCGPSLYHRATSLRANSTTASENGCGRRWGVNRKELLMDADRKDTGGRRSRSVVRLRVWLLYPTRRSGYLVRRSASTGRVSTPWVLPAFSPDEETSSAPVRFIISFARSISSDVLQWIDIRTPPFLTRPS